MKTVEATYFSDRNIWRIFVAIYFSNKKVDTCQETITLHYLNLARIFAMKGHRQQRNSTRIPEEFWLEK